MDLKYENEQPITEMIEALKLLHKGWGDHTDRTLNVRRVRSVPNGEVYIEVALYNSGYTREEYTSSQFYMVDQAMVQVLRENGYVVGTPHWGWTDWDEMRISEKGKEYLYKNLKEG